jgi:hypothetical protein
MLSSVMNLRSNHRGGASIALVIALFAVASGAQALRPAPAAAMIDMGGECGAPVVSDPSYCDENGGGGGYEQPGETIVIRDPVLPVPDGLPHEIGGRRQARADGPRTPFRSRHGARATRVAEIPLTHDECLTLRRGWTAYGLKPGLVVFGSDAIANRAFEEYAQITTKMSLVNQVLERLGEKRKSLKARLNFLSSLSHPSMHDKSEILELEETLEAQQQKQIAPLKQKLDSLELLRRDKEGSLNRLAEANEVAHRTLRAECERKYPKLFGK